ncbi:MAG: diaminopropionate ammonia-lyase [Eubacteriaceae bacterium]|nr:diaminopropionate ammonia-lyase [Eubacteriaceae bacterium]
MSETIQMYKNHPIGNKLPEMFKKENYDAVRSFHRSLASYSVTPLISLPGLAERLAVSDLYVKDESKRFGLNAFKGLGAGYAVNEVLEECRKNGEENPVFVTATDGNHGRAVAWAADIAGCRSYVFMPKGSKEVRAQAIRDMGDSTVEIMDLSYADCVRHASAFADEHGYYLVQDTGFDGYEDIPNAITLGYTTLAAEISDQLYDMKAVPSHIFLQAGVGSMAGGVTGWLKDHYGKDCPVISIVEAEESACCFESAKQGKTIDIYGDTPTIMAGLNCTEANIFTLPVLTENADFFFKCADSITELGMRALAHPQNPDAIVVSGESGAVTTGLVISLCTDPAFKNMKDALGLDENSVIVTISSEGDTDPEGYRSIIENK